MASPGTLLFMALIAVVAVVSSVVVKRRAQARRAVAWIRAKYGSDVLVVSGCLMAAGSRRVKSVMALTGSVIVFRPISFDLRRTGEIPLESIDMVMWEDAGTAALKLGGKYADGRLLTVTDKSGLGYHFILDQGQGLLWEKLLTARLV